MKNSQLIIEKQKEIIEKAKDTLYAYQIFTKWVLRHALDIEQSRRGQDHLHAIDCREKEFAVLVALYNEKLESELSALQKEQPNRLTTKDLIDIDKAREEQISGDCDAVKDLGPSYLKGDGGQL